MSPTIRIDHEVFEGLQKLAQPFVDTPNTVIKRLLEENSKNTGNPPPENKRAQKLTPKLQSHHMNGDSTKQAIYEECLLIVLSKLLNGSSSKSNATRRTLEFMKINQLVGKNDLKNKVSTGESKAENTIAWGRNRLKDEGYIKSNSRRGIWELTEEGHERANKILIQRRWNIC